LNFQAQLHLKEEIKQLLAEPTPIEEIQNKESQNANNIKTISNSKLTNLMTSRTAKIWIQ
jgi:CBS domain containing-hemolysin-like protein